MCHGYTIISAVETEVHIAEKELLRPCVPKCAGTGDRP